MAEESSHSQDLNNAFIIERTPTKGTKSHIENELYLIDTDDES